LFKVNDIKLTDVKCILPNDMCLMEKQRKPIL
jgi:hypothetical protein